MHAADYDDFRVASLTNRIHCDCAYAYRLRSKEDCGVSTVLLGLSLQSANSNFRDVSPCECHIQPCTVMRHAPITCFVSVQQVNIFSAPLNSSARQKFPVVFDRHLTIYLLSGVGSP